MAIHIKKINGHDYAYDVKIVWDKEEKKYKKQTKYLGTIIDKETKTYERKRNLKPIEEKLILDYGDTYILNETTKKCGLDEVFESVLPNEKDTLWALLFTNNFLKITQEENRFIESASTDYLGITPK